MSLAKSAAEAAARVVGDQPDILEALGLRPYWGFDTTTGMNQRGGQRPALREPDIVPDEQAEDIRLGRRGFNNFGGMAATA